MNSLPDKNEEYGTKDYWYVKMILFTLYLERESCLGTSDTSSLLTAFSDSD
jgi:hypothetical protein